MSHDQDVIGNYDPDQPPAPKRRRGLVAGVVAGVVAAVGLPLGGFALYNALSGGGTQPHEVLPGHAIAYFRVDVDPSAGQKIEALRLLRKFPAFEKETGIDDPREDVRKAIFEAMQADTGCELDFAEDVDPWLGERLGVGVFAPTDGDREPQVAVALQVKDEDTALAGIEELFACEEEAADDSPEGFAYYNEYLIIAETQRLADGYVKAAETDPLAASDAFSNDMERLGEQGVASMWFDGQGIFDAIRAGMADMPGSTVDELPEQMDQIIADSYSSGAAAFRFDSGYGELAAVVAGESYAEFADAPSVEVDVPESAGLVVGNADAARLLRSQWDALVGMQEWSNPDARAEIEQFEAQTGLDLPADLETLLGDNFVLSLDSAGLAEVLHTFDTTALGFGAQIATDQAKFDDVYARVQDLAAQSGVPLQLNKTATDDGVVVSTSPAWAEKLAAGGALTDTAKYQTAVADADEAQSVFYLDFGAFDPLVEQMNDKELTANFKPLQAVGASASYQEGYVDLTMRLTVD